MLPASNSTGVGVQRSGSQKPFGFMAIHTRSGCVAFWQMRAQDAVRGVGSPSCEQLQDDSEAHPILSCCPAVLLTVL